MDAVHAMLANLEEIKAYILALIADATDDPDNILVTLPELLDAFAHLQTIKAFAESLVAEAEEDAGIDVSEMEE